MSNIDVDQDITELHHNTILNSVDIATSWISDFDLDIFDDQHSLQQNSSLWEEDVVLQPLIQSPESTSLDGHPDFLYNSDVASTQIFVNSPASMGSDEILTSPNITAFHSIDDLQVVNDYTLESPDLVIVNEFSPDSSNNTINPNIMEADVATTSLDNGCKKRKSVSVGKPSGDRLMKKLKILQPSDEDIIATSTHSVITPETLNNPSEEIIATTSTVSVITPETLNNPSASVIIPKAFRNRKSRKPKKKIAMKPQNTPNTPAKMSMIKKLDKEITKGTFIVKSTGKTNAVCKAVMRDNVLLEDFATISVQIEKCEKNQELARRLCYKNTPNFQTKFKTYLKTKVRDLLKIGNNVTSKYHIVDFKSTITINVCVRNTSLISPEIANEILKLCDTCLLDDIMIVFNNNI